MAINSGYKSWHKPNLEAKTKQGYGRISNVHKYIGDPNQIIYRSSWEFDFICWCDKNDKVIRWSSEPIKVPYYDKVSNLNELAKTGDDPTKSKKAWKVRNYITDFWIELDKGNNITEKIFIEIKPANKLIKPIPPEPNAPLKKQRAFNYAAKEYIINEAKFEAMNAFAKANNAKFYVFTEHTLKKLIKSK